MKKLLYILSCGVLCSTLFFLTSCTETPSDVQQINQLPSIYPDYIGVTIPVGIAPLDFCVSSFADSLNEEGTVECVDVVAKGSIGGEIHSQGEFADFDIDDWHEFVAQNKGGELTFTVCAKKEGKWYQYEDFKIYVSRYDLEEWGLTYRRVAPGYEVFNEMGLYQRDLSNFEEYEIMSNTRTPGYCVNCHTSNRTNPQQFVFHLRGENPMTAIRKDGKQTMYSTATPQTIGLCVYPYWHPEGRYLAFSTNTTRQSFHVTKDERIEVFDQESDLQILDTENDMLILSPLVKTADWETYPAFSADGKTLYFCSARPQNFPQDFDKVKYSLCSIPFDSYSGKFGDKVDTLIKADPSPNLPRGGGKLVAIQSGRFSPSGKMSEGQRGVAGASITFPRPSYDGKWLMFTRSDYGCFPIWHKEADLYLMNLKTGESRPLDEVNSDDTESFHNWNLNSHWFVFASRRGDGLYTRLYLSSLDDEGKATKPFLLPQKNPKHYYERMMQSYNTPDFTSEKVEFDQRSAASEVLGGKSTQIKARF